MSEYDLSDAPAANAALAQRSSEQAPEQVNETVQTSLQRDPVDRVVCRMGDASCAAAHASTLNRSVGIQRSTERSLLRLQRQYGNRYVGRVLHMARAADGSGETGADVERSIDSARSSGHGLDHTVRNRMETSMGADFSGVRVHTDAQADSLSRSLQARAFTTGQDIFFRKGAYNPQTSSGRELLAHELTHVIQQNGDKVQRKMTVSQPGDRHELEADQMARAVMQQEQQPAREVDRQAIPKPEDEEKKVQTQPEATQDEEEKKKLRMKAETNGLARQTEEEQPEQPSA
jgi:hypothetical protein